VYCYINGGLLNGYRYIIDFAATSATPHAHMARKGHADWETAHHVFTYANALDQMLKRIGTTDSDKDVAAVRGVLHGAMALYLTRDLNVPPPASRARVANNSTTCQPIQRRSAPRCACAAPLPRRPIRRGELQPFEKLFLEVGVGGFPVRRTAAHDAALTERHHCARSATTRANSPAARTCQHVTASPVVPAHKVGLDGVLSEQHRHWILDMSGRYIPVDVYDLQSLNQSCFECLDHHVFQLIPPGRLCKA
jgi:hypothetical protein